MDYSNHVSFTILYVSGVWVLHLIHATLEEQFSKDSFLQQILSLTFIWKALLISKITNLSILKEIVNAFGGIQTDFALEKKTF